MLCDRRRARAISFSHSIDVSPSPSATYNFGSRFDDSPSEKLKLSDEKPKEMGGISQAFSILNSHTYDVIATYSSIKVIRLLFAPNSLTVE